ncbi:hypothetical protein [Ralstonia pseudosolanacearum]|nr:hypothetical protein [Ralstonia pseudosolanacearum]
MTSKTASLQVLLSAAALILGACGKPDQVSLLGIQPGMALDEVKTAAPAGTSLYCLGDGDTAFEQVAGLPQSTTLKFCTWSTVGAQTKRNVAQLQVGEASSLGQKLAFGYSEGKYTLNVFYIEFPVTAYDKVVASMTEQLGKPNASSNLPVLNEAVQWEAQNGSLRASKEDSVSQPPSTLLLLKKADAPRT